MLNKTQQKAVDCNDSKILCLAGAGSGKTEVMIQRISRLVADGVDPKSILALTFTNAAAFEMKNRYESRTKNKDIPEFRTFHSFCYYLLSKDKNIRKHIGYDSVPIIADESTEKRINREASMQVGVKLSEKKMYGHEPLSQEEAYNLFIILKAADRLMKQRNVITFNALCKHVCDLFVEDNKLIQPYKKQYKHILVDEYQETDKLQHKFLMSFEKSNLFVVGDALQNLYSFRGTTSQMIKNLSTDEAWTVIKLHKNYRSTSQICKYANRFSKSYADDKYRVTIESDREGPEVVISGYESNTYGKGHVPGPVIEEILRYNSKLSGYTAILARSNAEVESIHTYLSTKNIPFDCNTSNSEASSILKCILDDKYSIDWLATYLPAESYSEFVRRSTLQGDNYSLKDFVDAFKFNHKIQEKANIIFDMRRICQEPEPITRKCQNILDTLGYSKLKIDISEVVKSGNHLSDLIQTMINTLQEYESTATNLYVGTVHSVKGLEYDNVYVVGPSGYSWKLNNEDNNNIFYVAITRAKTNLTIYFAQ